MTSDPWPNHWFRVHSEAKWHRGIGKAAWCNSQIKNNTPNVEWEIRTPRKNLCSRCAPDQTSQE